MSAVSNLRSYGVPKPVHTAFFPMSPMALLPTYYGREYHFNPVVDPLYRAIVTTTNNSLVRAIIAKH
jgi:hypothetical protein